MKKNWMFIISIVILAVFVTWLLPIKESLSIELEYAREYDNNFNAQLFWLISDYYVEEQSSHTHVENNRVELKIGTNVLNIQEIRLDPTDVERKTAITSIWIKNHNIRLMAIPVRELLSTAQFNMIDSPEVIRGALFIVPESADPQIILNKDLINAYFIPCIVKLKVIISIWIIGIGIIIGVGICYIEYVKIFLNNVAKMFDRISRIVLLVAVFLVVYMAFNSFDYAHPDENMSKAAVDYYMEHWKPADIRDAEIADSFSAYGFSRLSELTFYYFFAGKVAWIAKNILGINKYYRTFNVLLFVIMVVLYYKKGKKNRCLFFMLGLTPQVWYIFSYTTSDAWDYFLSFLILYQLTQKESMLNCAMETSLSSKTIKKLVIIGGIFGALSLGKKNYYFVFLATFILLLYRLMVGFYQRDKKQIIIKYAIVVITCAFIFAEAKVVDFYRYDGNKGAIILEQQMNYADCMVDQDGEPQGIWIGVNMKERGIGLDEVLEHYGFAKHSYRSFAGKYGWMEYESSYIYYNVIGLLYGIILFILCFIAFMEKGILQRTLFSSLMCLGIFVFIASLWHSWVGDFQPQGRYLFAINFILGAVCYMYNKKFFSYSLANAALCFVGCLAIYSFIFNGICCLV